MRLRGIEKQHTQRHSTREVHEWTSSKQDEGRARRHLEPPSAAEAREAPYLKKRMSAPRLRSALKRDLTYQRATRVAGVAIGCSVWPKK